MVEVWVFSRRSQSFPLMGKLHLCKGVRSFRAIYLLYCMIKLKPEPLCPHSYLLWKISLFFHSRASVTESVDILKVVLSTSIILSKFHTAFNRGISCTYKFTNLYFMVFMFCLHFSSHWGWDDFCSTLTLADAYIIIFPLFASYEIR